jgi:thiol-disulfide isomerase/thioredoxin
MFRTINLFFLFILFLTACSNSSEDNSQKDAPKDANVFIKGNISNASNQPIVLELVDARGVKQIASASILEDGNFIMACKIDELGIYQLKLGLSDRKIIPLTLEPNDKIKVEASFEDFELKPQLSGTKWAAKLTIYMSKFNEFALLQNQLMSKEGLTQEEQLAEFLKIRQPLDEYSNSEILKDPSNPVNLVLSTSLTPVMGFEYWNEKFLETLKTMSKGFLKKYPNLAYSNMFYQQVLEIESGLKDFKLMNSGQKEAPEIVLNNPDGKEIKLSSLKGQVVLIDFWASWCGPCRKENPNVVNLYNKYKNKGFTVYSVSLDKDLNAWKQAINKDGLLWPNHVSDLKQWETPLTKIYNFNSIPFTVLLDRKGKIVGTNLRGEILEQKLKDIL